MPKRILLIGGSLNQTTMVHHVARYLTDYECWFSPYYADGVLHLAAAAGCLDFTVLGGQARRRTLRHLADHGLNVDERGLRQRYDLVVTTSDLVVPRNVRDTPIVLIQEGMTDPENYRYHLVRRLRLPRYLGNTSMVGLSHAYVAFCVASEGYRDLFVRKGVRRDRIRVTGIPNFDNAAAFLDNDFPHRGHVLAATSCLRETLKYEDRAAFIRRAIRLAGGRRLLFKLHPNERVDRATRAFLVAEIGINHNGDIGLAKRLIEQAARAGCDAVKFQKRTPDLCVPADQRGRLRQTPWGYMSYLDYRRKIELGRAEYDEIHRFCRTLGITWFASCWDEPSVDFIDAYDPPCYKIQSAAVTDFALLRRLRATGRPLILSTGMSNLEQIHAAVEFLDTHDLVILHSTSAYPCQPAELNLRMIHTLRREFRSRPIGYSGHEVGLPTTVAAVAMGACYVERHITLDRAMWGSDQAASIEPQGFARLSHYIRSVESALGDGIKQVYASEIPVMQRLRRVK